MIIFILLSVALMTLAERKVMAALQRRVGPKKRGVVGILQPFADGIKLVAKESLVPLESTNWLFLATLSVGAMRNRSWQWERKIWNGIGLCQWNGSQG
jgi:NADH:ubiquinone oxidoreductase subunit H